MIDLNDYLRWIVEDFEPAMRRDDPGLYARGVDASGSELYGLADMTCILYTLGRLDALGGGRADLAAAYDHFTEPDSGMILEKDPTHCALHNTAFALAAMELLDLPPRRPPAVLDEFMAPQHPEAFLASLDWCEKVYSHSHQGAGIGAIVTLAAPQAAAGPWLDRYFACCDGLFDPANGMMGKDKPAAGDTDQIGGTFHYAFLYEHHHRAMAFPEARIDAVLGLQRDDGVWNPANRWWLTLDGVYLLTRSCRDCGHRVEEVRRAVERSARAVVEVMLDPAARADFCASSKLCVHATTAALSILAEAQSFLGRETIVSDAPLKLVLDRRPFI